MVEINKNMVVVYTDKELKEVLEKDNEYTYVYLGNDITLTSGIGISPNKTNIVIDGTYEGKMYTYTDQKKLGTSDGIYLTSSNTTNVTVKNINITGYNYYGVIFVPENAIYSKVTVEYISVNYIGPQISYNPMGTTIFIDSYIEIKENYAAGNEVAECNKIKIGGFTTILHKSTANSAFWFRNLDTSFTILKNAMVYFTSSSRELFYGVNDLTFTIEKNASLYITANNGLAYGTYGTGSTLIDENATLSITKPKYSGAYATWYSYGDITVNKRATLSIINDYENITKSNYNILFMKENIKFNLNSPDKVVLYNTTTSVIAAKYNCEFSFTYDRINLFDEKVSMTEEISKTLLPTYVWYKENELSYIEGRFSSNKTEVTSSNYTEEELKKLPSLDNFNIIDKKIISIGTFPLYIGAVTDKDTVLSGKTEKYASVLIEYENVSEVVLANENGEFTYSYSTPLVVGTVISFICKTYDNVIFVSKEIEIVYSGELTLSSATKHFEFELYAMKTSPVICPRLTELSIVVVDTRINSSNWKLYASINHEMENSSGKKLESSLIFVDEIGNMYTLSDTPTLVYTGNDSGGTMTTTKVEWEEENGVLLRLNTPLENGEVYEANIIWTLEE